MGVESDAVTPDRGRSGSPSLDLVVVATAAKTPAVDILREAKLGTVLGFSLGCHWSPGRAVTRAQGRYDTGSTRKCTGKCADTGTSSRPVL